MLIQADPIDEVHEHGVDDLLVHLALAPEVVHVRVAHQRLPAPEPILLRDPLEIFEQLQLRHVGAFQGSEPRTMAFSAKSIGTSTQASLATLTLYDAIQT